MRRTLGLAMASVLLVSSVVVAQSEAPSASAIEHRPVAVRFAVAPTAPNDTTLTLLTTARDCGSAGAHPSATPTVAEGEADVTVQVGVLPGPTGRSAAGTTCSGSRWSWPSRSVPGPSSTAPPERRRWSTRSTPRTSARRTRATSAAAPDPSRSRSSWALAPTSAIWPSRRRSRSHERWWTRATWSSCVGRSARRTGSPSRRGACATGSGSGRIASARVVSCSRVTRSWTPRRGACGTETRAPMWRSYGSASTSGPAPAVNHRSGASCRPPSTSRRTASPSRCGRTRSPPTRGTPRPTARARPRRPYTVWLHRQIGDRTLYDGAYFPPREVFSTVGTTGGVLPPGEAGQTDVLDRWGLE